jgi:hypothetical protein
VSRFNRLRDLLRHVNGVAPVGEQMATHSDHLNEMAGFTDPTQPDVSTR